MISTEVKIRASYKLKCLEDHRDFEFWAESFVPEDKSEGTLTGVIAAFCGDCRLSHKEKMKSEGKCLW